MDKNTQQATDMLKEFIRYSSNPWRIVWVNFFAGVFRGLGTIIGASLVIGILFWILSLIADMPFVGEYARNVKMAVTGYVEETNYNDELNRLGDSLDRIEKELARRESAK